MARDDYEEEEALNWDGGSDPTHVDSAKRAEVAEREEVEPATGSGLLVLYGLFGGIFILYTVGWLIAVQRMTTTIANPFFDFMSKFGEFFAVASPAIWFIGLLYVTRQSKARHRVFWLVIGVVVLMPVPFVLGLGATA
jgi:hypothetical protein